MMKRTIEHVHMQCDEWLSTRNRKKVKLAEKLPKRRILSHARSSSSSLWQLTQNSQPVSAASTKQTSLLTFFKSSDLKNNEQVTAIKRNVCPEVQKEHYDELDDQQFSLSPTLGSSSKSETHSKRNYSVKMTVESLDNDPNNTSASLDNTNSRNVDKIIHTKKNISNTASAGIENSFKPKYEFIGDCQKSNFKNVVPSYLNDNEDFSKIKLSVSQSTESLCFIDKESDLLTESYKENCENTETNGTFTESLHFADDESNPLRCKKIQESIATNRMFTESLQFTDYERKRLTPICSQCHENIKANGHKTFTESLQFSDSSLKFEKCMFKNFKETKKYDNNSQCCHGDKTSYLNMDNSINFTEEPCGKLLPEESSVLLRLDGTDTKFSNTESLKQTSVSKPVSLCLSKSLSPNREKSRLLDLEFTPIFMTQN